MNLHVYDTGEARSADLVLFDANSIKMGGDWFVEMLPGSHKVVIESTWSNKFVDRTDYNFIADAGKKYIIGLYELAPGQDPATADFHERSVAYQFGRGALEGSAQGLGAGLMPVIIFFGWPLLLMIPGPQKEPPPTERPFNGCCFVWIQDDESGVVVAGVSPKSVKSEGDRYQPPND